MDFSHCRPDTVDRCRGSLLLSPCGATEAIVREIGSARQEIQVQAYSFISEAIAKALIEAKKRGVKIEAVLDQSNATARYCNFRCLRITNTGIFLRAS
jgi:phosphatidylserine/phosphatidylglycerophosphate/cardiolipin synthase-like enzyme